MAPSLEENLEQLTVSSTKSYEFSGPPYEIPSTAVDHRSSGIYLEQILCISLPQPQDNVGSTRILCEAMQATVDEIPILATEIIDSKVGGLRSLKPYTALLNVKDLTHVKELDYSTLKRSNFEQKALDADLLLPLHRFSYGAEATRTFAAQANYVKGGLLLAFGIHHFAMDATSDSFVARVLAANCKRLNNTRNGIALEPQSYYHLSDRKFDKKPFYNFDVPGDISSLKAYTLRDTNPPKPAWMKESTKPLASETFRISPSAIKALKKDAGSLPEPANETADISLQPYITSHDSVCGLIWSNVIASRVRLGTVKVDEISNFKMPVEFRALTEPPLASDYVGNAFMQMSADLPVSVLLGPNGLTYASHAIRAGIKEVTGGGAKIFVKVIGQAKNPRGMYANIDDITTTQMLLTSWKKFNDVPIDFGGFGTYEMYRLPHKGVIDGCPVVLPSLSTLR